MSDSPEKIVAESSVEPNENAQNSASSSDFLGQLIEKTAEIPKQQFELPPGNDNPIPETEPEPSGSSEHKTEDPKMNADRIRAEANMHVRMFDFLACRSLAMYSDEKSDRYKATEDEKKELADALAEWYATMDNVPKLPPWVFVLFTAVLVYGPKVHEARKVKKEKKTEAAKKKKAADDAFAKPVPFTIVANPEENTTASIPADKK